MMAQEAMTAYTHDPDSGICAQPGFAWPPAELERSGSGMIRAAPAVGGNGKVPRRVIRQSEPRMALISCPVITGCTSYQVGRWSGAGSNRRPSAFQEALQVQASPPSAV